jgi:D-alanine-D-alanine ligase
MTREELKTKKIGVLFGGLSAEREVSLKSGAAVLQALQERGYQAVGIDAGSDVALIVLAMGIDVAFVCLHGRYGEDGTVQGMLELLKIPYTGSGVLASALAMDKVFAKQVFAANGLLVAPYLVCRQGEQLTAAELSFGLPAVVKPAREGSSVGVSIVREEGQLATALAAAFAYDDVLLVEQFIKGREIQVGIMDDQAMGTIEVVPKNEFYDFEAKYTTGMADHICPAPLAADVATRVMAAGARAHNALGCSGYSRVDFLVTECGDCYLLEVNTLPGMTALSLLPEIAQSVGIPFGELVERIACSAAVKIQGGSR